MMKFSFHALLLGILIVSLVLPVIALAANPIECCTIVETFSLNNKTYYKGASYGILGASCPKLTVDDTWAAACTINMLHIVLNWIFIALMIFVIIMVLLGAFHLMTAGGTPENVTKGRNEIMYAAIGLIVALLAKGLPSLVLVLFG